MNKRLVTGLGVVGMMAWMSLFAAGLLLDSKPYREALNANRPLSAEDVLLAALLFTPTNVALLSVLAGFLGGCASALNDRNLLEHEMQQAQAGADPEPLVIVLRTPPSRPSSIEEEGEGREGAAERSVPSGL